MEWSSSQEGRLACASRGHQNTACSPLEAHRLKAQLAGTSQSGSLDACLALCGLHFHRQFSYTGLSEESDAFPSVHQYIQLVLGA